MPFTWTCASCGATVQTATSLEQAEAVVAQLRSGLPCPACDHVLRLPNPEMHVAIAAVPNLPPPTRLPTRRTPTHFTLTRRTLNSYHQNTRTRTRLVCRGCDEPLCLGDRVTRRFNGKTVHLWHRRCYDHTFFTVLPRTPHRWGRPRNPEGPYNRYRSETTHDETEEVT